MLYGLTGVLETISKILERNTSIVLVVAIAFALFLIIVVAAKLSAGRSAKDEDGHAADENMDIFESLGEMKPEAVNSVQEQHSDVVTTSEQIVMTEAEEEKKDLRVSTPEKIIEDILTLPCGDIEEIEIKTKEADIKLRYNTLKSREEDPNNDDDTEFKITEENQGCRGTDKKETPEDIKFHGIISDESERTGENDFWGWEQILREGSHRYAQEEVTAGTSAKFGPDNYNTSRTGKVYTEKELENQIKE